MTRRKRVLTIALACAAFSAASAQAQPAQPALPLSVQEAVDRAVSISEEIALARSQRTLAESQITQVRADALPQVLANVAYNRTLASIFDQIRLPFPENGNGDDLAGALPFGRPHLWNATISIAQPIYAAGRVSAGLEIARNILRAADLELREAEADLALQVRTAYFQVVLADDLIAIAEEAHRLAGDNLRQVELFRAQGSASDFDVLRARVERDNLEPAIVEARNGRRTAELNLKRLTNVPWDQPVVTTTRLEPILADVDRAALRSAVAARSSLRALDEVTAAREGAVRIAQSNRRPTVSAVGNFSFQNFPDRFVAIGGEWRRDWSVGVQMTMPIFDGARTRGQVDQARVELLQVQLQRTQVREALEVELEAALGEFDAARAQVEARRGTVGQARRALELAELRFRTGLATQLQMSDARLLLQQAQVNEAQAVSAYITALAQLERTTGGEIALVETRLTGRE